MADASLVEFLNMPVGDLLLAQKEVITINSMYTVEQTLETLFDNKISSAPVLGASEEGGVSSEVVGIVDVLDLAVYVHKLAVEPLEKGDGSTAATLADDDSESLNQRLYSLLTDPISKVINAAGKNPLVTVEEDTPLHQVVEEFARGIHRVVVVDSIKQPINVYTQSHFLKALADDPARLGSLRSKTIMTGNLGSTIADTKEITTMPNSASALDAINALAAEKLHAIAILSTDGKLWSQISASDVKGLAKGLQKGFDQKEGLRGFFKSPYNLASFKLTLEEFIPLIRTEAGARRTKLVWAQPGTSAEATVALMHKHAVHRVWLLDNFVELVGVVSITDLARAVLKLYKPL